LTQHPAGFSLKEMRMCCQSACSCTACCCGRARRLCPAS